MQFVELNRSPRGWLRGLRLSSTALLWAPLIYIVNATFDERLSASDTVDEHRDASLWRIVRFIAWLTLIGMFLKLFVLPTSISWWNSQSWTDVLDVYIMPNTVHPWHLAASINAVLALAGYHFLIHRASVRLRRGVWTADFVRRWLRVLTFSRGIISLYTIAVGIYLTFQAAQFINFPKFSFDPFPW